MKLSPVSTALVLQSLRRPPQRRVTLRMDVSLAKLTRAILRAVQTLDTSRLPFSARANMVWDGGAEQKIKFKIVAQISSLKKDHQQAAIATQSTTSQPQNHHVYAAVLAKKPAKPPIHHKKK